MRTWNEAAIPVDHAVAIVVLAGAAGGACGYLFTVHLVAPFASEIEAVWLTTVTFVAVGLYVWASLRPSDAATPV